MLEYVADSAARLERVEIDPVKTCTRYVEKAKRRRAPWRAEAQRHHDILGCDCAVRQVGGCGLSGQLNQVLGLTQRGAQFVFVFSGLADHEDFHNRDLPQSESPDWDGVSTCYCGS